MSFSIENKLQQIARSLFDAIQRGELNILDFGLYSGRTGILIFCLNYLKRYPDSEKKAILENYLAAYINAITSTTMMSPTYCSGAAGILDALAYLNKEGLYDVDFLDVEEGYKLLLQEYSIANILNGNYDLLHGGLGVVKYFHNDFRFANRVLNVLEQTAHKDGNKYKWLSKIGMEKKIGYNICLSHGMASIVAVLSSMTDPRINIEKRNNLIISACNYILSQQIDPDKYGCYFPSTSLENNPGEPVCRSRLGWCYGDLGIATSLWQAGCLLKERQWTDKALEILIHATQRRNLSENSILDAGLCHGSTSPAMIYYYMYSQTGNKIFFETCQYWMDITLKMGYHDNKTAGYEIWHSLEIPEYDKFNLLSGIAGIGMMMLTYLADNRNDAYWMTFFMLNDCLNQGMRDFKYDSN